MPKETPRQLDQPQRERPRIRFATCGELRLYSLDERELDDLARGSAAPLELNLAISFLSVFVSMGTMLLTTSITSDRLFTLFVVIVVVTFIAGVVLLLLWARGRRSSKDLLSKIKARMPPEPGVQQPLTDGTETPERPLG
jgi:hypothetical protein